MGGNWKKWLWPQFDQGAAGEKVRPGLYAFRRETPEGIHRYHLRVDMNGEGLLLADASEIVRLPAPAVPVVQRLLRAESHEEPPADTPLESQVRRMLDGLGKPGGRFPVFNLLDERFDEARQAEFLAPLQADLVVARPDTGRRAIEKLWDAGIPHVRVLPEPDIAPADLCLVVERAEDLGMIAGVRAAGGWLLEKNRLGVLSEVGLDYAVFPWGGTAARHEHLYGEPGWETLTAVSDMMRELEMTPVVEVALSSQMLNGLDDQLGHLLDFDLNHIELFAIARQDDAAALENDNDGPLPPQALRQVAAWVEELADTRPWQLVWLPPVECALRGDFFGAARRGPRAGGDVTIRVESNGDVLPPRGPSRAAGNLLSSPWSKIWDQDVFRRYRQRVQAATRCSVCPGLAICVADCPADPRGWALATANEIEGTPS